MEYGHATHVHKETHKMENELQRGYMLIVCDLTHAQSDTSAGVSAVNARYMIKYVITLLNMTRLTMINDHCRLFTNPKVLSTVFQTDVGLKCCCPSYSI